MSNISQNQQTCIVIGASHAGVNFAFALRREGWQGRIIMYDADPELPYHRPPLSKTSLTQDSAVSTIPLKSAESYEKEEIQLVLGIKITSIDSEKKIIVIEDGSIQSYDKLVLATGARPIIPPILGLETANNVFPLRTATDVMGIRKALGDATEKKIVVIGGGYIGLEIAASLKKLGCSVTVLEREHRILARVTMPEMSAFFTQLHVENGVEILTEKHITSVNRTTTKNVVVCADESQHTADIVIVGVGIHVNTELAEQAGLTIENGIKVNAVAQTSNEHIFAIGDCTCHHNPRYDKYVRLESVQNAVDQAKVAASAICGKEVVYDAIPWFWSDQYAVKLQIVGLSDGYDTFILRKEKKEQPCFSIWYFKGDTLLAVDAINNAKAYVIGTKFIKTDQMINKTSLADSSIEFKPANLSI